MTVDHRQWAREAIRIIEADFQRSADTHLIPLETPGLPGVELYFKDESSHPTGSLKHRLARSLFLYALCNGWLRPAAPVIEASSGSTAISEAYFARLLGLPFIAVMPASTSKEKIAQIAFYGGQSHLVEDPTQIYAESERLARRAVAISWTSSPMPSAPPTGGRTTTSPNRSSSRCATSRTRPRPG